MSTLKILTIVGPTSSGKTSLSVTLAKKFNGEIISADSRQIYKGLNIGTGKITRKEMEGVEHHLLDVINPDKTYTVSKFINDAEEAIQLILKNKHLPILTGGTFLYIDALLGLINVPEVPPNRPLRKKLESDSIHTLFEMLLKLDPRRAKTIDKDNKRRLIRALEIVEALGTVPFSKIEKKYNTLMLGIQISKEQLRENIHTRLEKRLNQGMLEEVKQLIKNGLTNKRLEELGIEYKYISQYLLGNLDINTMKQKIETKSWQYAKRQMTWLRRNKKIKWIESSDVKLAEKFTKIFLN